MACTEVVQVVDIEVSKDQTLEVVITLFSGLILAAIIVAVILIILFRKYIIKKCTCKCGGPFCCFCCFGSVDDKDQCSTAYLIHSWDEPGQEPGAAGDQSMTQLDDYENEGLVLSGRTSEFNLSTHSATELQGQDVIFANPGALEQSSNDDVFVETSFTDGQYEITEGTSFSFIDVFVAPRVKQHHVLYCCEKQSILKTETEFHQHWADFFLFLVETAASKLVAEGQASEKWKADLLASSGKSITAAQKDHVSVMAVKFEQEQEENGKSATDVLESSINGVTSQLLDTICSSLKETSLTSDEAEKVTTELRENLEKFEKIFFDVYLKDVEKLKNRIHLKEALMKKFLNDMDELIKEMNSHQKNHVKVLEKIQMGSRVQLNDRDMQNQDRLAPDVEDLWTSVVKGFESVFNEQKLNLKKDADSRVDRTGPREKFDAAIRELKEKLESGKKALPKFIESYCGKIRKLLESEAKSDTIEINFTATELNALIEMLGVKFLKKGIKEESTVYSEFTRSSGWVAPDVVNMIAQLNTDLGDLQESLRSIRQKQESELRALLNAPVNASQNEEYFSDLKLDDNFVQKMLEVQVDLSDIEKEVLANKVAVETKCYKIHVELNKLSQERRLKYEVGGKKARLHAKKETLLLENMAVDSNIKAMVELNLEEQNIETTHKEAVENTKSKLSENLMSARKNIEVLFQIEIEKIRRNHEKNIDTLGEEEKAINTLKSKLLERIPSSSERDRLLKEHQININVLDEEIQRSRRHQEQVLQQKIQARKLEKMEEDKRLKQQQNVSQSLYTVGSANRFAANCLVSLLMEVRHKRSLKELEEYHTQEGEKLKAQLKRRYEINTKHSLQFHEKELIVKLAAALNMTRRDLEKELQVSMKEEDTGSDVQLLTQSILGSYDKAVLESIAQ